MVLKNISNGEILNNIKITPTNKVYSSNANESEVETVFENYLKDIGFGLVGELYTKRTAKSKLDIFPSKKGNGSGYPDYVFYESESSDKIIAIGDAKKPDPKGKDNSNDGLLDCTDTYLNEYNSKHSEKIKIAFGYDGIYFVIKYLDEKSNTWIDININNEPLTTMPELALLKSIAKYGNVFSTEIQKNISKELLEPYFSQCNAIFRMAKSSLSAIDKAAEISIFIFLKIFSNDKLDDNFKREYGKNVWTLIEEGKTKMVNNTFKEFLNNQYENVFPEELIKVNEQSAKDLARIINMMFTKCNIDRMTDVKGNALEYYQKDSKDRKIGEFFTPRHLIDLISFLTNPTISFKKDNNNDYMIDKKGNRLIENIEKIYDPACGSGGFLIQSFLNYLDKYRQYGINEKDLKKNIVFGNELKDSTVMLTKLNMILLGDGHNHISNENALSYKKINKLEKIKIDNKAVLISKDKIEYKTEYIDNDEILVPYDIATSEPVVEEGIGSKKKFYKAKIKMQNDGISPVIEYIDIKAVNQKIIDYHKNHFGNFDIVMANHPYALEEPKKPDELFIKHMIQSVKKGGRIACIVGEKLLFDNKHSLFREELLTNITIESIISLPQGVFNPYTDVKTSILLFKNEQSPKNHKTWLVEVSTDGYDLNNSRNPISSNDIPKIKRLWEKWGGYTIENEEGNEEYKSFHKEEIGFSEFHSLDKKNWCVKRYNTPLMSLNSDYLLLPINKILTRSKDTIHIKDNIKYKQVTIKVKNRGVVQRDILLGKDIGTKNQFIIKKGQFIISKIDARNGAYGIVPDELDGAIITGNFWTFDINTKIVLPSFLTYLMRHEFFNQMCNVCSYGSTNRWYLDADTFNNFKIPLPKREKQKEIFEVIQKHLNTIKEAEEAINKNNLDISNIINNVVG